MARSGHLLLEHPNIAHYRLYVLLGFHVLGFALLPVKAVRPVPLVAPVHRDPNFLRDFEGFPTSNPTAPTDQD